MEQGYKCDRNGCLDISDIKFPNGCIKISSYTPPEHFEIACSLHEQCNLRCKFCYQEHASKVNVDIIRKVAKKAFDESFEPLHKYDTVKVIHLLFLGGELFSDDISDDIFDEYNKMFKEFRNLFGSEYPNVQLKFSVGTNGVWKKKDRVIKLLKDNGVTDMAFSYDPSGRYPNKEAEKEVRKSIVALHNAGMSITISFILTKDNIRRFTTDRKYCKYMKSKYVTHGDLNWYIGNPNWEENLPSDEEVFEFFKWAIDNRLFNIECVELLFKALTEKDKYKTTIARRQCYCKFLISISGLEPTYNCIPRYSAYGNKLFYGKFSEELTEDNVSDVKASLGIQKRGCLSCKYFNICQMPCWSAVLFEKFQPTACPLEKAFDYIKEEHIKDYKVWRDKWRNS